MFTAWISATGALPKNRRSLVSSLIEPDRCIFRRQLPLKEVRSLDELFPTMVRCVRTRWYFTVRAKRKQRIFTAIRDVANPIDRIRQNCFAFFPDGGLEFFGQSAPGFAHFTSERGEVPFFFTFQPARNRQVRAMGAEATDFDY